MINFKVIHRSNKSDARIGVLKTPHGEMETPCLISVATQGVIKALTNQQIKEVGIQGIIANTYHLHIKPGEKVIKKVGGLHNFMNWNDGPIMTDSGGFQVFSLGFGSDYGTGKMLKESKDDLIEARQQPKKIKITEDGVEFRSYHDGKKIFLGPKESIKIQQDIGADIIFAFDECTSPIANKEYTIKSLQKTHRWAIACLKAKTSNQAIYGIVQGGKFPDLRGESAKFIASQPFDGFGIGGEFGDDKKIMVDMLKLVNSILPEDKPRHLLGIGHLDDLEKIIEAGADTFDCITPTHYARHGVAFTSQGTIKLKGKNPDYTNDFSHLDEKCDCFVCQNYSKSYLVHLLRAYEITPLVLLTYHNLFFFNRCIAKIRSEIKKGKI